MDDLALLKEMADRTPLPSAADLSPARARLAAAFTQPTPQEDDQMTTHTGPTQLPSGKPRSGGPGSSGPRSDRPHSSGSRSGGPGSSGPRSDKPGSGGPGSGGPRSDRPGSGGAGSGGVRRRRRLVGSGIAVVGLAAAITGVVALGGLEQVGVAPPKANAAAELLHQAADAVRELPATPPRPDQFIYTKTESKDYTENPNGEKTVREAWLSADGTRDSLIIQHGERTTLPGCRDGRRAVLLPGESTPSASEPCEPEPAYLADMPTDAAGMRQFLEQDDAANGGKIGKNLSYLVGETYLPPASLAALFEVVADYPGLTVVEEATDAAGRPGVGVRWAEQDMTLVFDARTHAFLGTSGWEAIVARGVVDTVGQQP